MFGRKAVVEPDPLVEALMSERDHLRALVDQLQQQVLALSNSNAYRLLNQPAVTAPTDKKEARPSPYEARGLEYTPDFSMEKLKQQAEGVITD